MNPAIQKAINDQIGLELGSAYAYLAMSLHFEEQSYPGFAHWMRIQYSEELTHAEKIFDFVNDRDGRVSLALVEAPRFEWDSPLEGFEAALPVLKRYCRI